MTLLAAVLVGTAAFLAQRPFPGRRYHQLAAAGVVATGKRHGLSPPTVGTAAVVVACLAVFGVPMGLLLAAGAAPLAARTIARLETGSERGRRLELARQLPIAIDLLVAAVAAGRPAADAFALVGHAIAAPLGDELVLIASRLAIAGDEQAVWDGLRQQPALAALGRCFSRANQSGMPISRLLGRLADDVRRDNRSLAQQRARGVSVQTAAPLGLCFLPAFFLIGIMPALIGAFSSLRW